MDDCQEMGKTRKAFETLGKNIGGGVCTRPAPAWGRGGAHMGLCVGGGGGGERAVLSSVGFLLSCPCPEVLQNHRVLVCVGLECA